MKYLVVLLLSINLEYLELPKKASLTCEEAGNEWREAHATYHGSRNNDPKQQGWYTERGELFVGYYCQ
tara:strand:+ start:57 stop:260 length:204 start_codon:yes stop_codon:yes gene_type:complete